MANPHFVSNAIIVGAVVAFGLIIVGFLSDKPVWFWFALPVLIVGVGFAAMALAGLASWWPTSWGTRSLCGGIRGKPACSLMRGLHLICLFASLLSHGYASDKWFKNSDFSFSYPETVSVKEDSGFGISKVEASAANSLIVIIVAYPEGATTPDKAAKDLFTEVGRGFREKGAKLATDNVAGIQRSVGGKTHKSVQMSFSLLGVDMVYDVFGFEKNGRSVVWFIQYAKEDKEDAEASIRMMADSFE